MLIKVLCFFAGMFAMWLLSYMLSVGHSINVLKQTQRGCAALFIESEQGVQEILQLKYLAMVEADRSEQNIISQKYIDQMNLSGVKKILMRNYVSTFPASYNHVMEYSSWEELEDYVNKVVQEKKGIR